MIKKKQPRKKTKTVLALIGGAVLVGVTAAAKAFNTKNNLEQISYRFQNYRFNKTKTSKARLVVLVDLVLINNTGQSFIFKNFVGSLNAGGTKVSGFNTNEPFGTKTLKPNSELIQTIEFTIPTGASLTYLVPLLVKYFKGLKVQLNLKLNSVLTTRGNLTIPINSNLSWDIQKKVENKKTTPNNNKANNNSEKKPYE